jgi:uncharacterized cupin superfamily protein
MSKCIDGASIVPVLGTDDPPPFDQPCRTRERRTLGDQAGLTQFGVNLLRLIPGAWSSQRHWHTGLDEFVYVISGEVVLVSDDGEEVLRAGDAAGFKAGDTNGHRLPNRSNGYACILETGTRSMTIRDRRELQSRLVVLPHHLLEIQFQPERLARRCVTTIIEQQSEIRAIIESIPSLGRQAETVAAKAYPDAIRRAARETGLPAARFPPASPWTVAAALAFDPPEPAAMGKRRVQV